MLGVSTEIDMRHFLWTVQIQCKKRAEADNNTKIECNEPNILRTERCWAERTSGMFLCTVNNVLIALPLLRRLGGPLHSAIGI